MKLSALIRLQQQSAVAMLPKQGPGVAPEAGTGLACGALLRLKAAAGPAPPRPQLPPPGKRHTQTREINTHTHTEAHTHTQRGEKRAEDVRRSNHMKSIPGQNSPDADVLDEA